MSNIPITIAEGDGIGPEIMKAVLSVIKAVEAPLEIHPVEVGEKVYQRGFKAGIEPATWEKIRGTRAFLKAPITTPQGGGFKSLNVTIRTALGLYANVRPCVAYHPFIETKHPGMDVVIVRENEEDLYTGIEYRQSHDTVHALKMISRTGCEKIVRYAFEYARAVGRKKVTCFTKDNILKLSDGLFHKVFEEITPEYPDIQNEHWIVDIGAAKLADTPTAFDVIVMPNLYGDILSDVAAQIAGSVGIAGSANIGPKVAMFEAIHGSAPRRAGQNLANPSGLLLAAVMMLAHVGLPKKASEIHNAWLKTIEEGIHTYDIYKEGTSSQKVGTQEFAQCVISYLGAQPRMLKPVLYENSPLLHSLHKHHERAKKDSQKKLEGIDIFVDWDASIEELHENISKLDIGPFSLKMISNRGAIVWPQKMPETTCSDTWRCRFTGANLTPNNLIQLLKAFADANICFTHTENLYSFGGAPGYSLSQDEQ